MWLVALTRNSPKDSFNVPPVTAKPLTLPVVSERLECERGAWMIVCGVLYSEVLPIASCAVLQAMVEMETSHQGGADGTEMFPTLMSKALCFRFKILI